ncbi:hypothetical protein B0A50_00784 [Salinomyces thailandicus]|uniref:Uncharacterized protein n=1 Tax=Salinomyces thailandicus TaxID=706561 RepID=A0A4U0UCJ3_9PEZI|nr:hypothetical protein B0A50_00784 [Salinomyces thailandica]
MPRPSRYDWDDKRDICWQLYVEQRKTPKECVAWFSNHFNVPESELPSARLFRRQFTEKWQFPPRRERLTAEQETVVAERIRQLWEQNLGVKSIREALEDEGWELGDNEFQRIRKKNGYRRRGDTIGAYGIVEEEHLGAPGTGASKRGKGKKRKADQLAPEQWLPIDDDDPTIGEDPSADALMLLQQQPAHVLTPEEQARRAEYLSQVQAHSDLALANRKRRRRIRGYGHLPADDPTLAPRYSSETTLDECKAYLQLTNDLYTQMRSDYEQICMDMGIERKKTVVQNGLWQTSKDRLIRENMHLSAMLHPFQPDLDKKAVAVDVICADVTKRIRDSKKKFTVGGANNALGLNPTSSKEVRKQFYQILERDQYTTRLACGDEHWAELRQAWYDAVPMLQPVVLEGEPYKMKCVDILCRDATKRYNDDAVRRDPSRRQYQQSTYGPGPGSVKANRKKDTPNAATAPAPEKKKAAPKKRGKQAATAPDPNIDPALAPYPNPVPAYFRLSPESRLIGNHPRMWLGELTAPAMQALQAAAASKAGAATVTKVQGVISNGGPGANGEEAPGEDLYQIDNDGELQVYLEAAGEKSTFVVCLEGGYA